MVELRGRAAVERLRDRDPVARLEQCEEERGLCGESARERDGTDATLRFARRSSKAATVGFMIRL
jgi:hypothetical protein